MKHEPPAPADILENNLAFVTLGLAILKLWDLL